LLIDNNMYSFIWMGYIARIDICEKVYKKKQIKRQQKNKSTVHAIARKVVRPPRL